MSSTLGPVFVATIGVADPDVVEATETDEKTGHYPMWKVILHNDEKTTMEFVILILMGFFGHEYLRAHEIMMEVHNTGSGLAGVYTYEHAELRVEQVTSLARSHKFPLALSMEKA